MEHLSEQRTSHGDVTPGPADPDSAAPVQAVEAGQDVAGGGLAHDVASPDPAAPGAPVSDVNQPAAAAHAPAASGHAGSDAAAAAADLDFAVSEVAAPAVEAGAAAETGVELADDATEVTSAPEADAPAPLPRAAVGFLSALLPGLGHLVAGRLRLGALFLAPSLLLLVAAAAVALGTGRVRLLAGLANPATIEWLLVLQVGVLAWRLLALASSLVDARWPRFGRRDAVVAGVLAVLIVAPQAWAGYVTLVARETADTVFESSSNGSGFAPLPTSSVPAVTPAPGTSIAAPSPTPPARRLTVLLLGFDSGPGRNTALTDTMIVASLDPVGRTVSMVSVPRDMVDVPLPGGDVFHPKVNGLYSFARLNPAVLPWAKGDGPTAIAGALETLLGVHIDYYAQVNLPGFVNLVDSVGGVDIVVPHAICAPDYHEYGIQGFGIGAGPHHLDGIHALAYARIRKAAGESDFTRAARQQQVLLSIRDAVVRGGILEDPVGFLHALGDTVRTNVPPDLLPDLATLAQEIGPSRVYREVITYPLVHGSSVPDPRGSILLPDIPAIRALAARLFTAPGVAPVPSASPTPQPPASAASSTPHAIAPETVVPATPDPTRGPDPYCPYVPPPKATPTPEATPAPPASSEPIGSGAPEPSGSPSTAPSESPAGSAVPSSGTDATPPASSAPASPGPSLAPPTSSPAP